MIRLIKVDNDDTFYCEITKTIDKYLKDRFTNKYLSIDKSFTIHNHYLLSEIPNKNSEVLRFYIRKVGYTLGSMLVNIKTSEILEIDISISEEIIQDNYKIPLYELEELLNKEYKGTMISCYRVVKE